MERGQSAEGNAPFMALLHGVAGVGSSQGSVGDGQSSNTQTTESLAANEAGSELSLGNNRTTTAARRKGLNRLTKEQIEVLDSFFSVCGHPDHGQKKLLSRATGLSVHQVKFWFQNKRTQVKNVCGKEENYRLKVENELLREENRRLKLVQCTRVCTGIHDSSAQDQIVAEMERLKEQSEWLQQEISRLYQRAPSTNLTIPLGSSAENVLAMQHDTEMIAELAKNAMHTLIISAETQVALWLPVPGGSFEILNKLCYDQALGGGNGADAMVLKTEATRSDGVILLDATTILEYLMDADNYRTFFPGVLSGAVTDRIYVWPTSEGYNGVIQLMTIEMPSPSPLVPGRRCTFLRYCNVLQEGAVVVVDVSLDDGNGFPRCLKMPSGILIQSIKPNTCKVSVIEHVRVDDTGVHELYQPCLNGLLFGARRWIASMARQSARMRDVYLTKPTLRVSLKGRRTLLKLADDLLTSYAGGIAAALSDSWIVVSGAGTENNIKIAYKKTAGDGRNDAIISASASLLLPLPMKKTFDLLRDQTLRSKVCTRKTSLGRSFSPCHVLTRAHSLRAAAAAVQWDMLVNGGVVREEVPIARGVGSDDDVTVLHVKVRTTTLLPPPSAIHFAPHSG
ncbi:hypothetical protein ABZP36_016972 [Zizania latifolia]